MTASLSTFFPIADRERNIERDRDREREGDRDREGERERERDKVRETERERAGMAVTVCVLPSQDEWALVTSLNGERGLFTTRGTRKEEVLPWR